MPLSLRGVPSCRLSTACLLPSDSAWRGPAACGRAATGRGRSVGRTRYRSVYLASWPRSGLVPRGAGGGRPGSVVTSAPAPDRRRRRLSPSPDLYDLNTSHHHWSRPKSELSDSDQVLASARVALHTPRATLCWPRVFVH